MIRTTTLIVLACIAFPVTSLKAETSEVDKQILGAWQLDMTTPDGERHEPVVLVGRQFDNYVAWLAGDDGLEAFQNVRLEDDELSGTIRPKENPDVTVTLEAQLSGEDACKGVASYQSVEGDSGSFEFTGRRVPLSSFDEVSTWKLSFETPDNEQHSPNILVLSRGSELYAWYSGKEHQVPARELSVEGDQVTMKVAAETRDGADVIVTFRGTVQGDKIRGTAEYKMYGESGTFPFTGKQTSAG